MDLQRTLLIAVIGVLSFMLLTEWVAFKEQRADNPVVSQAAAPINTVPDVPAVSVAQQQASDDLPVVSSESETTAIPVLESDSNAVSVTTDVLELRIDLAGGDIFQLGLPQYHARIDTPNVPLLLLQRDERRLYVAQSGLIGQDGIDSGGRANFTSTKSSYQLAEAADSLQVDLQHVSESGIDITKRFTLRRGDYLVRVEYLVTNNSEQRWQANLFGQIKRDSSPDPSSETSSGMGMVPFLGTALTQPEKRFSKFDFEEMAEKPFKEQLLRRTCRYKSSTPRRPTACSSAGSPR